MNNDWETRVQKLAKALPYPPTPDIAAGLYRRRRVNVRRLAQIAAVLLIVAAGLLAVPQIRAGVIRLLRIGAVEVVVTTATPPARFGSSLPDSVLDFPGATTLDDARAHFGHPIPLPAALGAPDRVYLIRAAQPMVVLAWLDASGAVETSLHLLLPESFLLKMSRDELQQVQVNGKPAVWLPNPHYYMLKVGTDYAMREVLAHALDWEGTDGMTYRLETNQTLAEAIAIAESVGNG